ncbi:MULTISPECIES: SpoIIIAC/SpoIIIAD family protein [Sporosarcina]|uniref:SpoIIIAC/SpoIIIAD family protein n=1 Tax=Sporosarcina TaxID=1569 RepID=UPI00058B36C2|nr:MULTISPECIES: SpoIIIAC/SpoIIIAD family protein [Sporosarcina]WJY28441.1 SpoIIIAC/SpoIIIAD family protein [Sporosarcina sp. 0.2-SM1T-5]
MILLFQLFTVFLLLLALRYAVPQLHPMLYSALFVFLLGYVTMTVLLPFLKTLNRTFQMIPDPFGPLLIGSALLFFLEHALSSLLEESGYGSLATLAQLAVKISILSLWLPHLARLIQQLTQLITP